MPPDSREKRMSEEVKRYDLYMPSVDIQYLGESLDGDYMKFSDHDRIVSELRAEVERLKMARAPDIDWLAQLTRYEGNFSYSDDAEYYPWGPVEEAEDGPYVRFDDVQSRLRAMEKPE
jgi:hypothetical protein